MKGGKKEGGEGRKEAARTNQYSSPRIHLLTHLLTNLLTHSMVQNPS